MAAEYDREVAERTQADTEFLAREIAGVRLALADVVTGETLDERLDERLDRLTAVIEDLSTQVATLTRGSAPPADPDSADRPTTSATSSTVNDEN